MQTQTIKCSNLHVLSATLDNERQLMKGELELMKVARGCPKVKTILLVINKPLEPHFQFTKKLKWLQKQSYFCDYQWSFQSYQSTILKMSRCFPQLAKNYIIMWCSQLLCKRVQRSLPKKILMQIVRLTRALSLVSAYSDGSPGTPSILPLMSEHLWAGLNVCCAMMSGFN